MLFLVGSSPLMARSNKWYLLPILIALCVIAVAGIVCFIILRIKILHSKPEWIAKEKNRQTKMSDIKKIQSQYGFTHEEGLMLFDICKATQCPNIYYKVKHSKSVDNLFRQYYDHLKETQASDEVFSSFYFLLFKMGRAFAQNSKISATQNIFPPAVIFYINSEGEQFPFTLIKNTQYAMELEYPAYMENAKRLPDMLSRNKFMFVSQSGLTYFFNTRPIRYENQGARNVMVLAHTTNLVAKNQRHFTREFVGEKCFFSSVNLKKENGRTFFEPSNRQYPAKLVNVSGDGCCITTNLPIKEKQKLCIFFPSLGIDENTIGIIRHTRKMPGGTEYSLHVQFVQISKKVQNRIFAFVYKFEL